jgi:hypothetical protein
MIKAKIKEGHKGFYDQYEEPAVRLLEGGQTLTIERQEDNKYVCSVVNPSDLSKSFGVQEGMWILVHKGNLEITGEI